jgi:hypothetical protein
MLRTWIALECDDCAAQFPRSHAGITQPQDAAIYTRTMLRSEATQTGWQRYGGKDYCPVCEKVHRNQAARLQASKGGH